MIAVCALAVLQSFARVAIPLSMAAAGGPVLENPVSDEVMLFINAMFYLLGAFGLVAAYGLWNGERWGFNGTLVLSAVTIAFDVWAVATVQSSAAMGIVLPAVFIAYLLLIRKDFLGEGR